MFFMQNKQKISFIIIKYSLSSRALIGFYSFDCFLTQVSIRCCQAGKRLALLFVPSLCPFSLKRRLYSAGIWHRNDVILTSHRRQCDVANNMCPLG